MATTQTGTNGAPKRKVTLDEMRAAIAERRQLLDNIEQAMLVAFATPVGSVGDAVATDAVASEPLINGKRLPASWKTRTSQRAPQLAAEEERQSKKFRTRRRRGNITAVITAALRDLGPLHPMELWKVISRNPGWISRSSDRRSVFYQGIYNMRHDGRLTYDERGQLVLSGRALTPSPAQTQQAPAAAAPVEQLS